MIPQSQRISIKYEDLCTDPQYMLDRITSLLNIPRTEIRFSKSDRHNVAGSPHRFDRGTTVIRLDERWKRQLNGRDKRVFKMVGGWLNLLFGYR